MTRRWLLCAVLVGGRAVAAELLPFDQPAPAVLRASPKKVFAHYFAPFPISLDNKDPPLDYYATGYLSPEGEGGKHRRSGGYLRERPLPRPPRPGADWADRDMEDEVRRAVALGLDGFTADILTTSGVHWERLERLLAAAARVDPGFKIVPMPDMDAELRTHPERLAAAVRSLASSPAVLRLPDGRLVVAPYDAQRQSAEWWRQWLAAMRADGIDVALVPLFQGWQRYAADFAPFSAGVSDWGPRWPSGAQTLREAPAAAHRLVPIWMAPVAPQDVRPKALRFWEAGGSLLFRTMWASAIEGGADWVQIITWNDYSEGTEIAPSTGIQWAFADLAAYYVTWFKTGRPPTIVRDVLCYFHRVQAIDAPRDTARQPEPFTLAGGDPARDEVELLAFLEKPGTLEIALGGETAREEAGQGVTSFRVPLRPGKPVFRLVRGGRAAITLESPWEIRERVVFQDLLYRAGCSNRPAVR
jgi:hypothetical protein